MRCLSLAAAAALTGLASAGSGFTGKPVVSAYWPAYASQLLKPDDIPYEQLTHIDWFVAGTKDSYELELYGSMGDLKKLVSNAHDANVTVSMSIGGWAGSRFFSGLVATADAREEFAKSIKDNLDRYDFDGVDIDWEFPSIQGIGCNKVRPEDSDNLLDFLNILRQTVGPDARLSAAVSIWGVMGADGKVFNRTGEFANYLDYVTIMAYDVYGALTTSTGPLGPLYDTCATSYGKGASGATAAKLWTDAGFPANKLLLGIPAYSHSYVINTDQLSGSSAGNATSFVYQQKTDDVPKGGVTSAGAGTDICGTEWPGMAYWLYRELIDSGKLNTNGTDGNGTWTRHWDDCSKTPFLFHNATREIIPYDDPQSYAAKAEFVRQHGMAGINMFDLTGDTRDSKLIGAARAQLIGTFNDTDSQKTSDPPSAVHPNGTGGKGDGGSSAYHRARPARIFSIIHQALQVLRL